MNSPQISEETAGEAWASAVEHLLSQPSRDAVNLGVKIAAPEEDPQVSALVNALLGELGLPLVQTVANTIFPRRLAARSADSAALTARYRHLHRGLRRHGKNRSGTYFDRIVAFESGGSQIDQLTDLIAKLRDARTGSGGAMTSRYEVAVSGPSETVLVYDPAHDRNKRIGFPCLSFLSFHLHRERVHLAAHYRNHTFVERAYGNYVGLGGLLSYVAAQSSWPPGEMFVVSGHAEIECGRKGQLQRVVDEIRQSATPRPGS